MIFPLKRVVHLLGILLLVIMAQPAPFVLSQVQHLSPQLTFAHALSNKQKSFSRVSNHPSPVHRKPGKSAKLAILAVRTPLRSVPRTAPTAPGGITVVPGDAGYVIGWVQVDTTDCTVLDTGTWTVTANPTHGIVQFAITDMAVPDGEACTGYILPFNSAYYTWTDLNNTSVQDTFSVEWNVPAGPEDSSWVATTIPGQQGKDTGDPSSSNGSCSCDDPIDIGSGNVYFTVTDYTTVGTNLLDFTRSYNSRASASTFAIALGHNWRDTYDRYLNVVSASSVIAERADGQRLTFTLNGSTWTSDSDIDLTLTHTGSGTGSTWTLKDTDDSIEIYHQLSSGEGLLVSIQARNGYIRSMHYNGTNQLTSVTDSFNRTLTFTYQNGLLTTFTTPTGLVITYGYSSSGLQSGVSDQLASITYSDTGPGQQWLYTYMGYGFLLSFIENTYLTGSLENFNGYRFWTYDAAGRAISGDFGLLHIAYDDATGNRTVTNALGGQEVYKFSTLQGVPKLVEIDRLANGTVAAASETFTYDTQGYLARQTDWNGNLTTNVNNAHGLPTRVTEASGSPVARTTTTTYDATFPHLPDAIVAPRQNTTFTYDASGNMLTKTETDTSGGSTNGQQHTWTSTYGSFGHVLTAADPRGDSTIYTYDAQNDVISITDPLGHVTTYAYNTVSQNPGLPELIMDPNGIETSIIYDVEDRPFKQIVVLNTGTSTTTYSYLSRENTADTPYQIIYPDGSAYLMHYDHFGKLTLIIDSHDNGIAYVRDANEDITAVGIGITNHLGDVYDHSYMYDSFGRLTKEVGGNSQTTTYTRDANGNPMSMQDPNNGLTMQTFDALNRLAASTDPLHGTTKYAYDVQDNLISVTDPRNLITTYTYDGFGQMLAATSPDTGTSSYILDKAGNQIRKTDARGIDTNRTFDKLNRVLTQTYPAVPSENITYSYDATSSTNFGIGHLTGVSDESGDTAMTYNEHGEILTDTRTVSGKVYMTQYAYDYTGTLTGMTYPSGHNITYIRDYTGRIASVIYKPSVTGTPSTLASNVTYYPFGLLTGLTYGNGLTTTRTFDADYQLTGIMTSGSAIIQNQTYAYDPAGNITAISDAIAATRNQTFTYDADNQMTSGTGKYGTLAYTYDANGNRASLTGNSVVTSYAYPSTSNRLTSTTTGSTTYPVSYTANGDITQDARNASFTETFSYGNRNLNEQTLVNFTPPSGVKQPSYSLSLAYTYNAFGQRMLTSIPARNAATSYSYDVNGRLIAENDNTTGAMTHEYIWLDAMPIAQIEPNGSISYIHTDQTSTPQKITDATQKIVWDRIDEPFGGTYAILGPQLGSINNDLRSPGQFADVASALNYNWNRTLDPGTGRYIQPDPLGLGGGLNPYAYVNNNSLRYIDPKGTAPNTVNRAIICALLGLCHPEEMTPEDLSPPFVKNNHAQQEEAVYPAQGEEPHFKISPENPFEGIQRPQCPARPSMPTTSTNLPKNIAAAGAEAGVSVVGRTFLLTLYLILTPSTLDPNE